VTEFRDSRVSRVFEWVAAAVGGMGMALLMWVANNVSELKVASAVISAKVDPMQQQISKLSDDVDLVRRDVAGVKTQVSEIQSKQQQVISQRP
jgi:hypothetical protein